MRKFVLAIAVAACGSSRGKQSPAGHSLDEATAKVHEVEAEAARIRDRFANLPAVPATCPVADIVARTPHPVARGPSRLSYAMLLKLGAAHSAPASPPPGADLASSEADPGTFSSYVPTEGVVSPNDDYTIKGMWNEATEFLGTDYVAVLQPVALTAATAPGGTTTKTFSGGHVQARIVVFRAADATPICATDVTAQSNNSIGVEVGGGPAAEQKAAQNAAVTDLEWQSSKAADAALAALWQPVTSAAASAK
jgi:hypothetical protein